MSHYEIFSLWVLCLCCMIGNSYSISNGPALSKPENQAPHRRFYFYNPEILPHAAAALGMVVPQIYKPMVDPLGHFGQTPLQYYDYGGEEEEEEVEEHDEKPPLQLFTVVKPPRMSGKKKKKKGHQQHQRKPLKHFKKLVKKCLPFKVRIIKKSDIDNGDDGFYQNIRSQLPYGYGNEYFPQPPDKQELAVISLNTSNISENGAGFPQVLHFLYPRYHNQQPRPNPRLPPPRKTYRFVRPPRRPFNPPPSRPWPKVNPWRVAPPGRPVLKYPLKEPTPDAVGGSPPPSPLLKLYKDPRIPVSEAYVSDGPTEQTYRRVTPNYIQAESTTPTQIRYYQEQWKEVKANSEANGPSMNKYSDPDYYRYGTYNQEESHLEDQPQKYVSDDNFDDQEAQYNTKYNTISHSGYFATTSERVVTVTPTTSWVPIPQYNRISSSEKEHSKLRNNSSLESKKIQYLSGGFRNLTSSSYKFGDKIVAPRNCSLQRNFFKDSNTNCLAGSKNQQEISKVVVNSKGVPKYYNKQKGVRLGAGLTKHSSAYKKDQNGVQNKVNSSKFYVEEVPSGSNQNVTYHNRNLSYKDFNKNKARSYKSETEIVTAKHPQDDINEVYSNVTPNGLSSVRARRSDFRDLSAVVSGSMTVEEN